MEWSFELPGSFCQMTGIEARKPVPNSIHQTTFEVEYSLAPFVVRALQALGEYNDVKMEYYRVTAPVTTIEAIVELMGFRHTVRVSDRTGLGFVTENGGVDAVVEHSNHYALKMKDPDMIPLLKIHYGSFVLNSSSIHELSRSNIALHPLSPRERK